jgi:hypothetical protein
MASAGTTPFFQGLPPTARLTAEYFASVIDFGELMASADIST